MVGDVFVNNAVAVEDQTLGTNSTVTAAITPVDAEGCLIVRVQVKGKPGPILGVAERVDEAFQVTLKCSPLYLWLNDKSATDTADHGVNDFWFVLWLW